MLRPGGVGVHYDPVSINRLTPPAVMNKQTLDGYRTRISMSLSDMQ